MSKLEKIIFIGHSYHKITKSHKFILDYLSNYYEIEERYDESWRKCDKCGSENHGTPLNLTDIALRKDFKAIIFWQIEPSKDLLEIERNFKVVYFPMYDAVNIKDLNKKFDKKNKSRLRIFSFSKTLDKKLKRNGFRSIHAQYFLKPSQQIEYCKESVFFWQRLSTININTVGEILKNFKCKIHIHKALDPYHDFVLPTSDQMEKFSITFSEWIEDEESFNDIISKSLFYVAPRYKEGIGMSFLKAIAMGKIVIANNKPTMSEYITHKKNGFLCDFKNPKPLKIKDIDKIQKNVIKFAADGYRKWELKKHLILDIIESDKMPPYKTDLLKKIISKTQKYLKK